MGARCIPATRGVAALEQQLAELAGDADEQLEAVLLRAMDGVWPFPPHYQVAPQPLAALDLLEYPDHVARRLGREMLTSLGETAPTVQARFLAQAIITSPVAGFWNTATIPATQITTPCRSYS